MQACRATFDITILYDYHRQRGHQRSVLTPSQVAVLIPKLQIHQYMKTYMGDPDEASNLLSMVKQDFEEHRDSPIVQSSILQLMTRALDASSRSLQPTLSCAVAEWALETNREDLYRKALSAALSSKEFPTKMLGVVASFLDKSFAKNPEDVDWGKWWVLS